ncbi:MAG: hypothetical protein KDI06_23715, partial [Calditrichaeota bacterium]|nr:hypothetical protein [Calditrichota bacterium]
HHLNQKSALNPGRGKVASPEICPRNHKKTPASGSDVTHLPDKRPRNREIAKNERMFGWLVAGKTLYWKWVSPGGFLTLYESDSVNSCLEKRTAGNGRRFVSNLLLYNSLRFFLRFGPEVEVVK